MLEILVTTKASAYLFRIQSKKITEFPSVPNTVQKMKQLRKHLKNYGQRPLGEGVLVPKQERSRQGRRFQLDFAKSRYDLDTAYNPD